MSDEIQFACELCGKHFPADPDTMLECSADFVLIDDTGETINRIDPEIREKVINEAKQDPSISPFLKGAICICFECQDKFLSEN